MDKTDAGTDEETGGVRRSPIRRNRIRLRFASVSHRFDGAGFFLDHDEEDSSRGRWWIMTWARARSFATLALSCAYRK
jgi:hypothetical protein